MPDASQVENIFLQALEIEPELRTAFLDSVCAGDDQLRAEVASLLQYDSGGKEGGISDIVARAASDLSSDESMIGQRLANWEIVSILGKGGMGTVYLATRADDSFRKLVAIKLVRRGLDTEAVLQRFRAERQILAGLDHPYIARLIDGGTSEDGRPYFVMEYIDGAPIDRYCAERHLSVRERCRLFEKVCEAVAFAHRNLVIHRDLKPGNILITEAGDPKLLDFGIAKLLSAAADPTSTQTHASVRAMTPAYASPEQVLGMPVNTTTDVYSLGGVLFRVLTGKTPRHDGETTTTTQVPSSAAPAPLKRQIEGDLDNIVSMAMRPDPHRRYQSADQFAEDIRRYLDGRPVIARRETLTYLIGKYVRRHRAYVAMAAGLAVAVFVGTGAALWQAKRAEAQAHRAEDQRRIADRRLHALLELANRSLFDIHGQIESLPGSLEIRRKLVESTTQYLNSLARDSGNDPALQFSLATSWGRVADLQGNPEVPSLSDSASAMQTAAKAEEMLTSLLKLDPKNALYITSLASQHQRFASVLHNAGKTDDALQHFSRGLGLLDQLPAEERARTEAQSVELDLLSQRADVMIYIDLKSASRDAERAVAIASRLLLAEPSNISLQIGASSVFGTMGSILDMQDRFSESLPYYKRAVTLRTAIIAQQPWNARARRELMFAYGHLGDLTGANWKASLGDEAAAAGWYSKCVDVARSLSEADPADETARLHYGVALLRWATVLGHTESPRRALQVLDQAETVLEKSGLAAKNLGALRWMSQVNQYRTRFFRMAGNRAAAAQAAAHSLQICDQLRKTDRYKGTATTQTLLTLMELAPVQAEEGQREAALQSVARSVEIARQIYSGPRQGVRKDIYLPRALCTSGYVWERLGDRTKSAEAFTSCRDEWRKLASTPNFEPYRKEAEAAEKKVPRGATSAALRKQTAPELWRSREP